MCPFGEPSGERLGWAQILELKVISIEVAAEGAKWVNSSRLNHTTESKHLFQRPVRSAQEAGGLLQGGR